MNRLLEKHSTDHKESLNETAEFTWQSNGHPLAIQPAGTQGTYRLLLQVAPIEGALASMGQDVGTPGHLEAVQHCLEIGGAFGSTI